MISTLSEIYIGILSGTSIDAVDVVAVDFSGGNFNLLGTHSEPFSQTLQQSLHDLCHPGVNEINRLGQLDREVGQLFAKACNQLLKKTNLSKKDVSAIGSHGQTIRHQPTFERPFTLQIGDPNTIAELTGITTVADFRRRDIVCGGQGAPLTPAFHRFAFQSSHLNRAVVNIGGITNITFLPRNSSSILGFDSGPGNTLLDGWIRRHLKETYDAEGKWAKEGKINDALLIRLLQDTYFSLPPPKSTGREYFNLEWVEDRLTGMKVEAKNVQATLAELTACTIIDSIQQSDVVVQEILLCGGGVHNKYLLERLSEKTDLKILSTADLGVDPDWVEAIAFAWLARQTLRKLPGNLPEVTGASNQAILGGIYQV